MENKGDYKRAWNAALRLLSIRSFTSHEMNIRLKRKGFCDADITRLIDECKRLNYINDAESAVRTIETLIRKGFGLRRIRFDLKKRGLEAASLDQFLKQSGRESDVELETAKSVLQKRQQRFRREPDPYKRRQKIYRFLQSRGFSAAVITELLRDFGGANSPF